jgi:hypothetical protein
LLASNFSYYNSKLLCTYKTIIMDTTKCKYILFTFSTYTFI